jgi:hypothetical protein
VLEYNLCFLQSIEVQRYLVHLSCFEKIDFGSDLPEKKWKYKNLRSLKNNSAANKAKVNNYDAVREQLPYG